MLLISPQIIKVLDLYSVNVQKAAHPTYSMAESQGCGGQRGG